MIDFTSKGMKFTEEITSCAGASFILFPDPNHTSQDIKEAKAEIRHKHDVVSLHIASEDDRDYLYKGEIFRVPATKPLEWYQIEQDDEILRRERLKGTTPDEFVEKFVLPFVAETEAKYRAKYGNKLL